MTTEYGMTVVGQRGHVRPVATVLDSVFCSLRTVVRGRYWLIGVVTGWYHGPWSPDCPLLLVTVRLLYTVDDRQHMSDMPLASINLNVA